MRISDWSSDVCSSDLPRHVAQLCIADPLRIDGAQVGHCGPGTNEMHGVDQQTQLRPRDMMDRGERRRQIGDAHARTEFELCFEADRRGHFHACGELIETAAAIGVDTQRGQTRSEEHTSELPSLMRISYAVL